MIIDEIERAIRKATKDIDFPTLAYSLNFKTKWKDRQPDAIECEKIHTHLINIVQKQLGKQKLYNLAGLQRNLGGRFHIHGILQKPKGYSFYLVEKLMLAIWATEFNETTIGRTYDDIHFEYLMDNVKWATYSTRFKTSVERIIPTNSLSWSRTVN